MRAGFIRRRFLTLQDFTIKLTLLNLREVVQFLGGSVSSVLPNKNKILITIVAGLTICFASTLFAQNPVVSSGLELKDGYYPVYPTPAPAVGEQAEKIKRGQYLSQMGDCIACHTYVKAGTPPFAGGLPIATPFGTFYSPNITPDKETGIGNWTEDDFVRAMKEGRSPSGGNYFPVFPYLYFSKMTDEDARDLYAYFMSIPPVYQENKSLPFPFNLPGSRTSLWGWNLLFFFPENKMIKPEPTQSAEWNRGRYIVDGLGHCSMCHTPLNPLGAPKNRFYLSGTFIDGYWAPNIMKSGLDQVSVDDIANVFKKGELLNHAGPVAGPMADVNHNSLAYLTDEDQHAIGTYIKTVVSQDPLALKPSDAKPTLRRGKQVYVKVCSICHQDNILSAPVIGDSANWYRRLQSSGLTGLYTHAINGYNSMPIKGACVTCSNNDIISATDYILNQSLSRSQWRDLGSRGSEKYPASGKATYNENCSACHTDGEHGAPKIGDKAAWDLLVKQNLDTLVTRVINGESHPKKGGCSQCTTNEIMDAIKYILRQSKVQGDYRLW